MFTNRMKGNITIMLLATLSLLFCCTGNKEKETPENKDLTEGIVGEWDAQWEMSGEEARDYEPRQRRMSGKMMFNANGEVRVTTYGFNGCIFMQDTSSNTMNYKIENQVLRFMDKKDVHGIPYNIESYKDNEIQLSIMESINLTLKK